MWEKIKDKVLDHQNNPIYIGNAFSLNMINPPSKIEVYPVSVKDWYNISREIEAYGIEFRSFMGHKSTTEVYNEIFGANLSTNRINVKLDKGVIVVFQISERLPEGKILSKDEIQKLIDENKVSIRIVLINHQEV